MPTTLPAKTADDLGTAVTNARAPRANEVSAINFEKIKDRIIELGTELGLLDGSTPNSVWAALQSLKLIAATAPGASEGLSGNNVAGAVVAQYFLAAPAGEPADPAVSGAYYLHFDNGVDAEDVLVYRRVGNVRYLTAPLQYTYNAGSATVAYAGPATDPATAGLMPSAALALLERLQTVEPNADVTDAANVASAGAVMDADFAGSAAGRLVRTGVGTYAVVKDNLAAAGVPTSADDETQGYQRGSLWFTGVNMWVCVDATAGFAEWYRVAKPATGTPADTAATGSVGSSAEYALANHVHALHAHAASHAADGSDPITSTRAEAGTSFAVDGDDNGATIYTTATSTVSVTVDQAAAGDSCLLVQAGAGGQVQLSAGAGVTLRYASAFLPRTAEQWSPIALHWRSATEVLVSGDLEAAP